MDKSDPQGRLTHLNPSGDPSMVDVTGKDPSSRSAIAEGWLRCSDAAYKRLTGNANPKGNVEQVASLAGIMAGKRTADLIPLCHALPGASVTVTITRDPELPGLRAEAEARYAGRTGVEMEALTAVSVALLTAYDMLKAVDKGMVLENVRLVKKTGGASGSWSRSKG